MTGLDTNVLIRYLAQDDPHQSAIATRFIEGELHATRRGFICLIVLVETCWVLKRLYGATEIELTETVADLLGNPSFQIESRAVVQAAVLRASGLKSKAGVTDFLIAEVCKIQGCSHTVSFDKKAVQQAGMQLLV